MLSPSGEKQARPSRGLWLPALLCCGVWAGPPPVTVGGPRSDAPGVPATARAIQEGSGEPVRAEGSRSDTPDTSPGLTFVQPFDGAVYPRDIAPPLFQWRAAGAPAGAAGRWEVAIHFAGGREPVRTTVRTPEWRRDAATWAVVKHESLERPARLVVSGHRTLALRPTLGEATVTFSTSPDPVEAPIFYRDVNLPFIEAVKDPSDIRWRFGSVTSENPPPVVLDNLPVCGNCHSFSRDGRVFGMDVDYANSKGSYVVTATAPEIALAPRDIITWDEFRREDGELTFGLLSQVSPDGRWVVSTVKDKSVFVPRPGLAFSQLFFPVKGILALYHRESGQFRPLPGADDPAFVQSNPTWSPDGRYVVFARAPAHDLSRTAGQGKVLLTPEECREYAQEGRPFRFDLFRLAFNDGQGGQAEPLEGASGDGRSNFFPKHSPDGRWIVFCKASNHMLLQPDSELCIIPADGGPARRLRGNTSRMNSWHSWSPNGRWLVFSSKALSDYTQLFLTQGLDGVWEVQPGRGRKPAYEESKVAAIVAATLQTKPKGSTHRSCRTMARPQQVSPNTVNRVWQEYNLKPHRTRTFTLSRDVQYLERLTSVVGLHLNPPERIVVLCLDKKSPTRALDRMQPGLPLEKGRCGTLTHDYVRHGARTMFAAREILEGKVIGQRSPRHP